MKRNSVSTAIATGLTGVVLAVFTVTPFAAADSPGQIGGGDIYRIKNLTKNTDFTDPATANACEKLEYKVRLHNSGFDSVTNIVADATLPSNSSTSNVSKMTVTYSGGVVPSVSDTATLNLTSAQSVSYVSGTTQLLDGNNNLVKALPDGVTQGGVNVGTLNGSTVEFVQFQAQVNCPTPPVTPPTTPPTTPATPATPTALVNTGPGSVAAIFAAATAAGTVLYRRMLTRRLGRQ